MKKVIAILLVSITLFSFAACGEELSMVSVDDHDFVITDGLYFATKGNNGYVRFRIYYGNKPLRADEVSFICYGEEGNPSGGIGLYRIENLFICNEPTQEGTFGIDIIYGTHVMHTGWHIQELEQ